MGRGSKAYSKYGMGFFVLSIPTLQEPFNNPARLEWHEVKRIDHYWLRIDAATEPMQVHEAPGPYRGNEQG
jgi:hypothetical protein